MHLSDHSLSQLDEVYIRALDEEPLRGLSLRLLEDLKEARERLGQNPTNSSRPPSSQAPWDRPSASREAPSDDETPHSGADTGQPEATDTSVEEPSARPEARDSKGEAAKPEQ